MNDREGERDDSMDTPETFISPARQAIRNFRGQLREIDSFVSSLDGRLRWMEGADPGDPRIPRIIAGAALAAQRVSDAGTLTRIELEAHSRGAKPPTGTDLVAQRDRPGRKDVTEGLLRWVTIAGFGLLGLTGSGIVPPHIGSAGGAVAMLAAWIAERPQLRKRRGG